MPVDPLQAALEQTHRMLAEGRQGAWDKVIELEQQRREQLEQVFAAKAPVDAASAARIRAILELDRQLIELGSRIRDAVADELSGAQRGRKVARAYHSVGS